MAQPKLEVLAAVDRALRSRDGLRIERLAADCRVSVPTVRRALDLIRVRCGQPVTVKRCPDEDVYRWRYAEPGAGLFTAAALQVLA